MGLIGIRMGLVLKDKPACPQTENASENNAKKQYAYMAYCAMLVNTTGFFILVLAIISKFDDFAAKVRKIFYTTKFCTCLLNSRMSSFMPGLIKTLKRYKVSS